MIDPARWAGIKTVALEALDLPRDEQEAYLARACGNDTALRAAVEALLAVSTTEADLFDHVRVSFPGTSPTPLAPGTEIDHFRVIRLVGEGAMGLVYEAEDTKLGRPVALKILSPRGVRFSRSEQRILSRLVHPNIAALYESGTTDDGMPYLVMEYVDGTPLAAYCEEHCPTVKSRLMLFLQICEGVQYAHQNLVIHRDLKPGNILVTKEGIPKLVDFGIARRLPPDMLTTRTEEVRPLTVAFSSPEHLRGKATATTADVYSLGVLLSVMLTGSLPYHGMEAFDLIPAILSQEPERLSFLAQASRNGAHEESGKPFQVGPVPPVSDIARLPKLLRGDLDAIAFKALRKEPESRYQTVAELAADIRRQLGDEPVSARRGSRRYRAVKFWRRNTGKIIASGLVALVLLTLGIGLVLQYRETIIQSERATREAKQAVATTDFLRGLFEQSDPWTAPDPNTRAIDLLWQAAQALQTSTRISEPLRANLLSTLGSLYISRGSHKEAEPLLLNAIRIQTLRRDTNHLDLASSYQRLGTLHLQQSDYTGALRYLRKARTLLALNSEGGTRERAEVLGSVLGSLGAVALHMADHSRASSYFREAIKTQQQAGLTETDELGVDYAALGQLDAARGNAESAERNYRTALDIMTQVHGASSGQVGAILEGLAVLNFNHGNYVQAESDLRSVEAIVSKRLGRDHPYTLGVLHNLASVLAAEEKLDEALALFQEVYAKKSKELGRYHQSTLTTLGQVGSLLVRKNDLKAGEATIREALEGKRRLLPSPHPDIAASLNNLGNVLYRRGRVVEASTSYRESLEMYKRLYGRSNPAIAVVLVNLADIELDRGDLESAVKYYREAVNISRGLFSGMHPGMLDSLNNLAMALTDKREYEEAAIVADEALVLGKKLNSKDWHLAFAISTRAWLEHELGNPASCQASAAEGLRVLSEQLPPNSWRLAYVKSISGACLAELGRFVEAESVLRGTVAPVEAAKGLTSHFTVSVIRRNLILYERWNRPTEVARYRRLLMRVKQEVSK